MFRVFGPKKSQSANTRLFYGVGQKTKSKKSQVTENL